MFVARCACRKLPLVMLLLNGVAPEILDWLEFCSASLLAFIDLKSAIPAVGEKGFYNFLVNMGNY